MEWRTFVFPLRYLNSLENKRLFDKSSLYPKKFRLLSTNRWKNDQSDNL